MIALERLKQKVAGRREELRDLLLRAPVIYQDLEENLDVQSMHLRMNFPYLLRGKRTVVDVGPGNGCFLALSSELGNATLGIEQEDAAPVLHPDVANMVRRYLSAYSQINAFWGLDVRRYGFHHYLQASPDRFPLPASSIHMLHLQKSFDGVLLHFQGHVQEVVHRLLVLCEEVLCEEVLCPGGLLWIGHNTGPPLDEVLHAFESQVGPPLVLIQEPKGPAFAGPVTRVMKP